MVTHQSLSLGSPQKGKSALLQIYEKKVLGFRKHVVASAHTYSAP
jgi:hypothetical protein